MGVAPQHGLLLVLQWVKPSETWLWCQMYKADFQSRFCVSSYSFVNDTDLRTADAKFYTTKRINWNNPNSIDVWQRCLRATGGEFVRKSFWYLWIMTLTPRSWFLIIELQWETHKTNMRLKLKGGYSPFWLLKKDRLKFSLARQSIRESTPGKAVWTKWSHGRPLSRQLSRLWSTAFQLQTYQKKNLTKLCVQ